MKLTDTYLGANDPFEGDRTIWLRSVPANARVTKATVTLTPVAPAGREKFEETITFTDSQGDLGASKATATDFVEVDFHTRRTLAEVEGTNIKAVTGPSGTPGATLQVDIGGAYVDVNSRGAIGGSTSDLFPVPADGKLPGLTVSKFKLTRLGANPAVTSVTIRSAPTNVSVRLGQMPPFWTRPGELAAAATSPDFSSVLNLFLAEATVENGHYVIPVVVHSDTIARLDVTLDIDYVIEQRVLPPQLTEITLPYGFSTLPGVDESLTTVALPRQAIPVAGKSGARVQGQFQPTRVADGPIGEEPEFVSVEVSPECSLAQTLQSAHEIELIGVDLPLGKTLVGLAGLNVAIRSDDDGKPSIEVLASAEVRVDKPLPGQSTWGSATLQTPFRILPGVRYWLVLQSQIGKAFWNATRGSAVAPAIVEPALQCSRDGGLSWRAATAPAVKEPLAALIRLRNRPERFSIPVQLQIGKGPGAIRRRLDEYAPLGRVEFNFDFAEKLTEHLAKPELASPCGTGELLTNGGFDDPPHDDATRRLFGFDGGAADESPTGLLTGTVDLSQGADLSTMRFITLSIGDELIQRTIDCAGPNPALTSLDEIIGRINREAGESTARHANDIASSPYLELQLRDSVLHPWRRANIPPGWQSQGGIGSQIWRAKLPTVFPDEDGIVISRPERIVAVLEADGIDPAILAQSIPVTGGCSYALRFAFQTVRCIDFRGYQAVTLPNPMLVQGVEFEVEEKTGYGYPYPASGEVDRVQIEDLGHGVIGLNCGTDLAISLPRIAALVELIVSTAAVPAQVTIKVFSRDTESPLWSISLEGDPFTIQNIRLPGPGITRIEIHSPGSHQTLLHALCFDDMLLSHLFVALSNPQRQAPFWDVHWLDAAGQLAGREQGDIEVGGRLATDASGMFQEEIRLVAPPSAVRAEIRFIQPSVGVLFLDDVSLMPTLVGLRNSRFRHWRVESNDRMPAGWSRLSGRIEGGFFPEAGLFLVKLISGGPDDTVLAQTSEVTAGERYEFQVIARPESPPANGVATQPTQHARLELRWLGDGPIGAPVALPLDGRDFPTHAWSGVAPAGAKQAEIRLIQPKGQGNLIVESVSFTRVDLVRVPLIFLAETPGEMTLGDLRVTYDLPTPPAAELTAPSTSTRTAMGAAAQPAPAAAARAEVMMVSRAEAAPAVAVAARPRRSPLADMPASIVAGVGQRFSRILGNLRPPIATVADLAALDPEISIPNVPRERRIELKATAELIMNFDLDVAPFAQLAAEPLDKLLSTSPARLARRANQSIEQVKQLRQALRALRLLIKNENFRDLRLSDLVPGQG